MRDIIIIGGGVIGTSIARELSKYKLNITLLEKEEDISCGVSKANSGIVHSGHNEALGSLKAKLCVEGNKMFDSLSKELDFPFKRNGALVLAFNKEELFKISELAKRGKKNGVEGLEIIYKDEIKALEKNISDDVIGALYVKTSGIVSPYEMTIALAENANLNGVEFKFEAEVNNIEKIDDFYRVTLKDGEHIDGKFIINAAGIFGDKINNMINTEKYEVEPIKGEYLLFDKVSGELVDKTIFRAPSKISKGVLITRTVDGNLLLGPNAEKISDKNNVETSKDGQVEIVKKGEKIIKELPLNRGITTFAGVRPHIKDDFIIEEISSLNNFINVIGIDSPGLTAAPAIAVYVKKLIEKNIELTEKNDFNPYRKGILKFNDLSIEEKNKIIKENPSYGKIVCKCELITEGEVIDSINRPLGARTVDGVKRRTRATMGGCQGIGCLIPISTIISRELNISINEVVKNKKGSNVVGFKEEV